MMVGEIPEFDTKVAAWLIVAEELIRSDELERAEKFLHDFLPGRYRDDPPKQILEMRKRLYRYMMNAQDYIDNPTDIIPVSSEQAKLNLNGLLRGQLLKREVVKYNEQGITPHIFDLGPGDFWMPLGLLASELKFTYQCQVLSTTSLAVFKSQLTEDCVKNVLRGTPPADSPQILFAGELIEHLRSEHDIVHAMHKAGVTPTQIHLSTPMYTFGGGVKDWSSDPMLGRGQHFRTYTPHEFLAVALRLFQGYTWTSYIAEVQSLVGIRG